MINKIMQMKERGERVALELIVSREDYVNQNHVAVYEREAITKSSLVITSVLGSGAALELEDSQYCIPEKDYKYFKIKEPDFNDLIDVAVQAKKDGVISGQLTIMSDSIHFFNSDRTTNSFTAKFPNKGIEHIKSLYTETFEIESEGDIERVKVGALIELSNGNSDRAMLTDKYSGQSMVQFSENKHWGAVGLFILKGATVTQEVSK